MGKNPSTPFIQMDKDSANKRRAKAKASGHVSPMMLDARSRQDAMGADIAPFDVSKLPKGEDTHHHFGVKNPKGLRYAVVCFTHHTAALCRTRHQATIGAFNTAAQDKRTPKQIAESGSDCPLLWCDGCVQALAAST